MKKSIVFIVVILLVFSCKNEEKLTAQDIVDKAIEVAGGETYKGSEISFDFRGRTYTSKREAKGTKLIRLTIDSTGKRTKDILAPTYFKRMVNDSVVQVPDSMITRYSNSVNSVHYFAYLPQGLNDKAVNKELLEDVNINEVPYYKLRISFDQEGGGTDFEDIFVYWINKNSFKIDYLAYEFHVDGGGVRMREAYNERYVNGLRFVDYKNYKPAESSVKVEEIDEALKNDGLKLLSKIELENISVKLN